MSSPYDRAKQLSVIRGNAPSDYAPTELDDEVKYFVLMLEQLGCSTLFSCGGHLPSPPECDMQALFYIAFIGDVAIVDKLVSHSLRKLTFTRSRLPGPRKGDWYGVWRMALSHEYSEAADPEYKDTTLREVAASWDRRLGPLRPLLS